MDIDFDVLYHEAIRNNMLYMRVPVYDFDRIDQVRAVFALILRFRSLTALFLPFVAARMRLLPFHA